MTAECEVEREIEPDDSDSESDDGDSEYFPSDDEDGSDDECLSTRYPSIRPRLVPKFFVNLSSLFRHI